MIDTGDADAVAGTVNTVNTTDIEVEGCGCEDNDEDNGGHWWERFHRSNGDTDNSVDVSVDNDVTLINDTKAKADSGDNEAAGSEGGDGEEGGDGGNGGDAEDNDSDNNGGHHWWSNWGHGDDNAENIGGDGAEGGAGGNGGDGDVGGEVRTGRADAASGTVNTVNTTVIRTTR